MAADRTFARSGTFRPATRVNRPIVRPEVLAFADFADSDQLLVVANNGGPTRVVEIKTGEEKKALDERNQANPLACVSADGTTVASSLGDGRVILWNCRTGERLIQPLMHEGSAITAIEFAPDGKLLATATEDGWIRMWDAKGERLQWRNRVYTNFETISGRLKFSNSGSALSVSHQYYGIATLDAQTGMFIAQPIATAVGLASADWMSDEQVLSITADGVVRLWTIDSNEPAFLLPHGNRLNLAIVADNRKTVATIDADGTCCISRADKNGEFHPSEVSSFKVSDRVMVAALSPDGAKLAVANAEGAGPTLSVFETASHRSLHAALPLSGSVCGLKFTPDGRRIACVTDDKRLTVWDVATANVVCSANIPGERRPSDLDVDVNGRYCAVSVGRQVLHFDLSSGAAVGTALIHAARVGTSRFVRGNAFLVTGCSDGRAYVWDLSRNRIAGSTAAHSRLINFVDVSVDGSLFLTGSQNGTARVWSAKNAAPNSPAFQHDLGTIGTGSELWQGCIDPTNHWVVTVAGANRVGSTVEFLVYGWDIASGELLFVRSLRHLQSRFPTRHDRRPGEPSAIAKIFFSSNGRSLHLITSSGVFSTLTLRPDRRGLTQLHRDVLLRAGRDLDRSGELRTLEPKELADDWNTRQSND